MDQDKNNIRIKIKIDGEPVEVMRQNEHTKALKAEYGGAELLVLGLPFGGHIDGRDEDGEAFHDKTDMWMIEGDSVPVTYLHGYGPDSPGEWQERPVIIGKAAYAGMNERGHWFDVTLDGDEPLAKRIEDAISNGGNAKASTGAVSHLVRMGKAGLIDVWPVGELAIFDVNEWRQPDNQLAVVEAKAKDIEEQAQGIKPPAKTVDPDTDTNAQIKPINNNEVNEMTEKNQDEGVQSMEQEQPAEVIFDYAELAREIAPAMGDLVRSEVKAALEAQEPITAKGAPAIKKVTTLGNKNDNGKEIMHYLKTGQMPTERRVNMNDWSEKAALQEGTATEGGYLVPDDFYARIVAKRDETSIARQAGAMVIPTSLKVVNVPVENTAGGWTETAEEGAYNEDEPTFAQVAITVYKHTNLVKVSEELADDNQTNLDGFLSAHIAKTLAKHENNRFLVGTGSSQPQGVYVGGTAGLTFDYATTIAAAEIPELMFKLKAEYMDEAVFSMRNSVFGYLMGLTGDNFQLMPTPAGGLNYQLLGHPVYASSKNAAQTTGLKPIVFGNWGYYGIAERKGLVIQRNPWLYMANGQIGFFSNVRFGGAVLQAEAFQYATMA